jgi:Rrf2 family transcriptional regulator, cysteine metabolism repressor
VKLSAKAEYACVAMAELAARFHVGQPVHIKTVAELHGISPRFLVQILIQLKGAGLVASSRGSAGGYQLARPPETICLADIVNAIDRSPGPAPFHTLASSPIIESLREVWKGIDREEQRLLGETSLAALVQQAQGSTAFYQI